LAGYSKRPLAAKLGIEQGMKVTLLSDPAGFRESLGSALGGVRLMKTLGKERDFIHAFFTDERRLVAALPRLRESLAKSGILWVSWPKRSSGVATDLDGNVVRRHGLASGLVDTKVCAVDETWSGLKFVYRKKDR
jgi:hypothetical protein